jgi:hypothetical protein
MIRTSMLNPRAAIITALCLYAAILLGCVLANPQETSSQGSSGNRRPINGGRVQRTFPTTLPFRGVSMQLHRIDWLEEYKTCIDEIVDLGADTVQFVVDARMENGTSSRIYLDMRLAPGPKFLGDLIDYAKSKNLRVILMPIVLLDNPRGNEWRGTINPEDWTGWWDSYRQLLHHYATICERHKVDMMSVGSELVSTESKYDEWRLAIQTVRWAYKGMITYSANWDHYKDIPFWEDLDVMSTNTYWSLGDDHNVTLEEIQRRWADIQKSILSFARGKGRPLYFTEVGWCSLRNAASEPWDYTQEQEPIDLKLQARLYEGFFRSWQGKEGFGGFSVWEWSPGEGGPKDRGYTPENKPAEKVIREWLGKMK